MLNVSYLHVRLISGQLSFFLSFVRVMLLCGIKTASSRCRVARSDETDKSCDIYSQVINSNEFIVGVCA